LPISLDSCLPRNEKKVMQEWKMDNINVTPAEVDRAQLGSAGSKSPG